MLQFLENGKLKIDDTSCIHCGICSNACHFGAIEREAEPVFRIFVRRNGGKQPAWELFCRYYHLNEIEHLLEKTLLWYRSNGYQKKSVSVLSSTALALRYFYPILQTII